MNREVYANTGVTAHNTSHSDEGIYDNELNLETCWNRNNQHSTNSGGDTRWSRSYRITAMCVVLLCVLLLTAITVLWIKYNILITENNQLQTGNNNLTIERDQLLRERDGCLRTFGDLCKWCFIFGSLYFMYNEEKNWTESRQICMDKGADLVIINNREEQEFISKQKVNGRIQAWIGLSDRETEGEWKWVDGTPLTTAFWASGEPNNAGGDEDCAEFYSGDTGNFWNDKKCTTKGNWICEKHLSQ
ncbi:CD209 antigen-like protein E [Clarias gariepinus]|uniref:CD209 antigen-like protein E n=1 Tax=Clarias gariepinus TaxID=13013 RepID=UPI00234D7564|nr:CD209 antigen-like protein E [Clarias gariepinus]